MNNKNDKLNNNLINLLRPIQRRLFIKFSLFTVGRFSFAAILCILLFSIIARFIPIPNYNVIISFIFVLSIIAAFLYSIINKPTLYETAKKIDSFGLKERTITALENINSNSHIAIIQKEDAINQIKEKLTTINNNLKILPFSYKQLLIYSGFIMIVLVLFFIPNSMDSIIAENKLTQEKIEELKEEIEEEEEKIKENKELTQKQKDELLEKLNTLDENITGTEDINKLLEELQKSKKELANLSNEEQLVLESLKNLNKDLSDNNNLADLANAAGENNQELLTIELEKLKQEIDSLSESDLKKLIESLEKAANNLEQQANELNNEQLKQLVQNLQAAADNLKSNNINSAIGNLNSALTQSMTGSAEIGQYLSMIDSSMNMMNQSQLSLSNSQLASNNSSQTNNSNSNANNNSNSSQNNGSGNSSNGSSSNGSSSNGSSSNSNSGSGTGTGTGTNTGIGQNSGNGAGLGEGTHKISVPSERIEGDGEVDTVTGPLGEGNSQTASANSSLIAQSIYLPYQEVYMEYEEYMKKLLEEDTIPNDYQDIIKEYFISIEP